MIIAIELDSAHTRISGQILQLVGLLAVPGMESITVHPFQSGLSHVESLMPKDSYLFRTKDTAGIDWNTTMTVEFLRAAPDAGLEYAADKHLHEFNKLRRQHGIMAPIHPAKIGENKPI